MNHNILFYSNKCKTCEILFNLLKNNNMIYNFKLICVDNILDKIPKEITRVPTILLYDAKKPLVCNEIFEWLNTLKNNNDINNLNGLSSSINYTSIEDKQSSKSKLQFTDDYIYTPEDNDNKISTNDFKKMIYQSNIERNKETSFFKDKFKNDVYKEVQKYNINDINNIESILNKKK